LKPFKQHSSILKAIVTKGDHMVLIKARMPRKT